MKMNKTVLLCVSGGIAAYKIPNLARMLTKTGVTVHVLMTENAKNFINPIVFETLTSHKCLIDTFDRNFQYNVEHVALAKAADIVMVAPASANVIGKIANGIADDMLTTTVMACPCHKIIVPAMNHNMYHNPIVQDNLKKLDRFGYEIVAPAHGMLANGDTGDGRMPEEELLFEYIMKEIAREKDLEGKKILITAGATHEAIDPVRYITNHSTGKMGYAIAKAAMRRGAEVTLISGKTAIAPPPFVKTVPVVSAQDMFEAVKEYAPQQNIIIKAAAVADYRPAETSENKIKKTEGDAFLKLERTTDILAWLGSHRIKNQIICGFSMETENLIENSKAKLKKKNIDMIAANNLNTKGAGFGTDTNVITIITEDNIKELDIMSKNDAADAILDEIIKKCGQDF
ncbi:MAG: bifunctional phosphopantothenoylcysteine decarboxylase/phosphopantothenate--cysteine ligase CoaBC [bacterium]|nr:bifunctional phosphopantothenoylcysteine decarboxylase/phosphopantothenate--cysteine ligase CoaBC [bacterium]